MSDEKKIISVGTTARPRGSASGPMKLTSPPKCKRCGTAVEPGVKYCETCEPVMAQKRGPQAMVEIAPQPEPEYVKERNVAYSDDELEDTNAP